MTQRNPNIPGLGQLSSAAYATSAVLQALGLTVVVPVLGIEQSIRLTADLLAWLQTKATQKAGATVDATRGSLSQVTAPTGKLWIVWSMATFCITDNFTAATWIFAPFMVDIGNNTIGIAPLQSVPANPVAPIAGEMMTALSLSPPLILRPGESAGWVFQASSDGTGDWLTSARITELNLPLPVPQT